jgi:hypothetical protein
VRPERLRDYRRDRRFICRTFAVAGPVRFDHKEKLTVLTFFDIPGQSDWGKPLQYRPLPMTNTTVRVLRRDPCLINRYDEICRTKQSGSDHLLSL